MHQRRGIQENKSRAHARLMAALVALAVSGACNTPGSEDEAKARGAGNLADSCEVIPPYTPNFEPELQWEWTGSTLLPEFKQVMMTPAVADVNQDGIPDIIFSAFRDNPLDDYDWKEGVLRAISGDDGHDLWAVGDPAHRIKAAASIAVGDIDNDGLVEICGIPFNGRGIICYENDGTFKFRSAEDAFDYNEWGGPSLADLDGDGTVEILDGNRVYSNTGALKWVGSDGMGGAEFTGPVSFGADIDGDNSQEVINGRSVYKQDGSLKCANTNIPHGMSAVGNFDGDLNGEIAVAGHGKVSLLDDDCTLLWSIDIPGGCNVGCGGGPTLADVDSDGLPEIAVVGNNAFSVIESDGTVKWSHPIQEWSSGKGSGTAFDFEDDGHIELVHADEIALRIFNGATGEVRFQTRHSTGTTHEYPVIADVDGDLAADIVVSANNLNYPPYNGIRVYHDRLEGWARTRRMWNQHAYSITNINNDGSIPTHPVKHWLQPKLNTFRSNVANYFGDGPSPYAAPDVAVSQAAAACTGGTLTISASVDNLGATSVAAGLKVAFYSGDPASGGALLGVATVSTPIPAGSSAPVSWVVGGQPPGASTQIFIVADDDGTGAGRDIECNEANNSGAAVTTGCTGDTDGGTPDGGSGEPDGGSGEPDGGSGEPDGGGGHDDDDDCGGGHDDDDNGHDDDDDGHGGGGGHDDDDDGNGGGGGGHDDDDDGNGGGGGGHDDDDDGNGGGGGGHDDDDDGNGGGGGHDDDDDGNGGGGGGHHDDDGCGGDHDDDDDGNGGGGGGGGGGHDDDDDGHGGGGGGHDDDDDDDGNGGGGGGHDDDDDGGGGGGGGGHHDGDGCGGGHHGGGGG
ncbi:MAG: VCBS repeat-containing protein [Myxococcaceae bacterium]|nr:VCBS repeat-containing protein [Myxococcaceae bacterium]